MCSYSTTPHSSGDLGHVSGRFDSESLVGNSDSESQLNMLLSQEAAATSGSPKTLRFLAQIQGISVVILVDSGSSHSSINDNIAPLLQNVTKVSNAVKVQVANGLVISSDSEVKQACWVIQDQQFISDLKVISLLYYDMILGIDWLEAHSPMKIDWLHKWMVITVKGTQVHLYGLNHSLPTHSLIELHVMSDSQQDEEQSQLPPQIQQLLDEFSELFEEPHSLPPNRSFDHSIPLIQGAQPVSISPYRFSQMRWKSKFRICWTKG